MERTKRISMQTLAIAILSVLLVASLLMSATGAWFTSTDGDNHAGYTFGSIELAEIGANVFTFTLDEASGDVIMPGDTIDVDFDITNSGTADMYVRFKIEILGTFDESTFATPMAPLAGWVVGSGAYEGDGFYYRSAALVANTAAAVGGVVNDTVNVAYEFVIPTTIGEVAENQTISFVLTVDAVQVANNTGSTNGTDVTGYPVV